MTGAYWGVGRFTGHYGPGAPQGYPEALVDQRIATNRTDLDAFSEAEASVLENHGYPLADAAVAAQAPALVAVRAPLAVPNPAWMDEALRDSGRLKLPFGRDG